MNPLSILVRMIRHSLRRGKGVFKLLFVIDDFIRLFAMTFLIPLFLEWIGLEGIFMGLGVLLGMAIDIHDYWTEIKVARI